MKVVLLALNAKFIHSSLAIRALAANCGVGCELLELTVNNRREDILARLYRLKPDVLGLSCYIWSARMMLGIAAELRKVLPGVRIIAGGPEAAYDAEAVLKRGVDIVATGEAEVSFAALAANGFKPRADIPGIAYMEHGAVVRTPVSEPELNGLNFAYAGGFDGLDNKIVYYESSRGCPYACAYCMSALTAGVRLLDTERVYRHLDEFLAYKPPQVKFVDRTFNADRRFALDIWRYLIAHDNGVTNFHFEISAGLLDAQALEVLADARPGLFQFEIGVQSANPETLRAINRPNDLARLFENVRVLVRAGNCHIHLDLIAGLPKEDMRSFRDSFNKAYSLMPHQLQLGFLKLLKGSVLRERGGIVHSDNAPYEVLRTDWLGFDELLKLKQLADALETYYNTGMFRGSVRYIMRGFESPFEFYNALAEYRGDGLESRSKERLYRDLYAFGRRACGEGEVLRELLRFDFCLNEKPRALPEWLRNELSGEQKKRLGIPKRGDIALERFGHTVDEWARGGELTASETYVLFDYRASEPVVPGANCRFARFKGVYDEAGDMRADA